MTIKHPSLFFRALILGAQGVFYNLFCGYHQFAIVSMFSFYLHYQLVFSYLISPSTCHRFVGHLEEEAVLT